MATRSVGTGRNSSMRSSIKVVWISRGVRARRIANTSGVIASFETPWPRFGRMKVMWRISQQRDFDVGEARFDRRRGGGAIVPVHEMQERAVLPMAPPFRQRGGERVLRGEPDQRECEAAPMRLG